MIVNSPMLSRFCFALLLLASSSHADARLEVCNQTDLVLIVAVGYDTGEGRTASSGWWRIYPGFCEVPVDVAMIKGDYYLHAESNPRSTMPVDAFNWGEETPLCVELNDFRIPDGNFCKEGNTVVKFNKVEKNWRNHNKIDVRHSKRSYQNQQLVKVAGIQRLLSMLGYDVGEIDGVLGEKTVDALNEIGAVNKIFGFDFKRMFPLLEQLIADKHNLDN
jgi:uncharacterized membrane protein